MAKDGIYNWTLPALGVRLPDGRTFNVCPSAGFCSRICYARWGTYQFKGVRAAHLRNLIYCLDFPDQWERQMSTELDHPRFAGAWIRVHDAGDFYSDDYVRRWLRIIRAHPDTNFYCYTKEVPRFRRIVEPEAPPNFRWCFSLGGRYDWMIGRNERHADIFPSAQDVDEAGYTDQTPSDLLSVLSESPRVGIPANNIPHLVKRLNGTSIGRQQARWDAQRRAKRRRAEHKARTAGRPS